MIQMMKNVFQLLLVITFIVFFKVRLADMKKIKKYKEHNL